MSQQSLCSAVQGCTLAQRLAVPMMFVLQACLSIHSPAAEPRTTDTWQAPPATIKQYQEHRPGVLVEEHQVPEYQLPPVLPSDGSTPADWPERRAELLELFRANVYGKVISKPESLTTETLKATKLSTIDGGVCQKQRISSVMPTGEFAFDYLLYAVEGEQRPVFVMINNRDPELAAPEGEDWKSFVPVKQILDAGFALAVFQHNDVAPDNRDHFREGILQLALPEGERELDAPGAIAAWSWGASRVLDSLSDNPLVDTSKAAIIGHSRGGKTALWTGVQDARFSLVISNNSGCMGAAISRRRLGERVDAITRSFDYWFCPRLQEYADHEDQLPVDQHQLIALSAPRHVYVASANDDLWADPRGEWLALTNAHPAFELLGIASITPNIAMPVLDQPKTIGATSYHVRTGGHNLTEWDWQQYLNVASRIWQNN